MHPDDKICLCFSVTKRKLTNYLRVEKPSRPSQLSQCEGAGTGCGWCVPFLKRLFEQSQSGQGTDLPTADGYAKSREQYIRHGKGTPPA
jgi:NAD(P)H-nitrite reductase large subunit